MFSPVQASSTRSRIICPTRLILNKAIFFLSLTMFCFFCLQPAQAQYGGSGWVPQKRANANTGTNADYDLTGLAYQITYTPGTPYSGITYGGGYGGLGAVSGANEELFSLSGPSTYEWLWTPTGSNAGASAPALYALVSNYIMGRVEAQSPDNAAGLSGSVSLNSGTGHATYDQASPPLPVGGSFTERAVLPAPLSGSLATLLVSPSVVVDLKSTLSNGSAARGGYQLTEGVYPTLLSAPDPMGRPDLGDGANQEVYDNGVPGKVNVPSVISLPGADTPDTSWVAAGNHVDMTFAPTIAGQQPHPWSGFQSYIGLGSYYTFVGLPTVYNGSASDPNSFGNHLAILKVDGNNSQSANFQTFFDMKASNWPGSNGYVPNWFWYYQQAYTPPQSDIEPVYYNATLGARGRTTVILERGSTDPSTYVFQVEAGPNAVDDDIVPVFAIDGNSGYVKEIGGLSTKGIYNYIRVIAHEEGHVHLFKQGIAIPYKRTIGPPSGVTDADTDSIPDNWEDAHHLDKEDPDTTKHYGPMTGTEDATGGDAECLADILALGELEANEAKWNQDWGVINTGSGYEGLQYGKRPLYFPWQYTDDSTFSISLSLPNGCLTALP